MNKTLAWVLVGVVVIGGAYYTLKGNKPRATEDGVAQEENSGKKMAFSEFAKRGGAYKCEVKQSMSDFENSGTVYMDGGKMRGEFSSVAEGRTIDTSFVYKDGFMYTWSSAMGAMGFKMEANPTASTEEAAASGTYSWNTGEIGDYNCVAWDTDSSKFELPAGITFRNLESK